jgi:hypothetical protein
LFRCGGRVNPSGTPEEILAFVAKEREIWREVVRLSGAQAE